MSRKSGNRFSDKDMRHQISSSRYAEARSNQVKPRPPVLPARVIEHRRDRLDECAVLGRIELDDLAASRLDGAARVFLFALVNTALERDGILHGLPHGELKILGPGVESRPMQEDRSRDVEMAGEAVKAIELVDAVGHRVRQWIFLRV